MIREAMLTVMVAAGAAGAQTDATGWWGVSPPPGYVAPGYTVRHSCPLAVPAYATLEGETSVCPPTSATSDTFNPGCNGAPAVYGSIALGQTIAGTLGTNDTLNIRDTDWYQIALTPGDYEMTFTGEVGVTAFLMRPGCPAVAVASASAPACTDGVLRATVTTPGQYVVVVVSSFFSGVPCGSRYVVKITPSATVSYQGLLTSAGAPVNGTADVRFTIFGAVAGGTAVDGPYDSLSVPVNQGTFTTTFTPAATTFDSSNRFLEVAVRSPAGTGAYTTLTPRQRLTKAPYAIRANSASSADSATNADAADVSGVSLLPWEPATGGVAYMGGRAGVGTLSPTQPLHVVGNARIDGSIIIPTTTRVVSIPGCEFVPTSSATAYTRDGFDSISGSTAGAIVTFRAPINLPDGATITDINMMFIDNDAVQNFNFGHFTMEFPSGSGGNGGTFSSAGAAAGVQAASFPALFFTAANNSARARYINASWTVPAAPTNLRLFGARVTYTITSPLP